ncbi:winged helix-turn-helix domain-containing protein [Enterobacter asburiae]|uniref:winged helix-turn-helix domain-containing protein n=1 Tax=Enterobacter asburiae TaxID=61645 RepID=UPI00207648A6|nr:winged helix-turn-helix domain-containing protein [Enterobacter asburiae]MCM7773480.1 winged helix-turn-helix domain-containing protein [Enterobacter asburiae]
MITDTVSYNEDSGELLYGDKTLSLTEKESRLWNTLLAKGRGGDVVSREQLVQCVWPGREKGVTEANLLQLVCKLRRTLAYAGLGGMVKTVYRQGYTLALPVLTEDKPSSEPVAESSSQTPSVPPPPAWRRTTLLLLSPLLVLLLVAGTVYQSIPSSQRVLVSALARAPRLRNLTFLRTTQGYVIDYQTCDRQVIHRVIRL